MFQDIVFDIPAPVSLVLVVQGCLTKAQLELFIFQLNFLGVHWITRIRASTKHYGGGIEFFFLWLQASNFFF